jgi:hypothetical protein
VKQLKGVLVQINDFAQAPRGKPFLVVTDALSKPTMLKLQQFLADNVKGVEIEIRRIGEADILETSRRLRRIFGLPELRLPSGAKP